MARIEVNTIAENIDTMSNSLKQTLNLDVPTDKRSAWYMLMYPVAFLAHVMMERQQIQADKMNIYKCSGFDLDDMLAGNANFRRKNPSFASVDIKLIGGTGVILEVGDIVLEAKDGILYYLNQAGTLNTDGYFSFICEVPGAIGNKNIGDIIKFVKIKNGVYDFVQDEASAGGQDEESDNDYINRWQLSKIDSYWNIDGIYSEVLMVNGVESVNVTQNYEMFDVGGMKPKSLSVVVQGGKDEDIAAAIFKKNDYVTETLGTEMVMVKDLQGIERIVKFYRPDKIDMNFKISYTTAPGVTVTVGELEALIIKYLKSLKIGSYITSDDCQKQYIRPLYGTDKLLNIDITFKRKTEAVYENVLKLNFDEVVNDAVLEI